LPIGLIKELHDVGLLKILAGAFVAASLLLAGTVSSFAASAPKHPNQIVRISPATAEGAIVVAQRSRRKRRRNKAAKIGGAVAGIVALGLLANEAAKANRRRADDDDDDDDRPRRRVRRDDDDDDRPRRRTRRARSGDAYERCADAFKSFRDSDGTYQPYDSDYRKRCPYL